MRIRKRLDAGLPAPPSEAGVLPSTRTDKLDLLFWCMIKMNADRGWCDELGSCEYRRLHASWLAEGRPGPISAWIRRHANTEPRDYAAPVP